jgi:hypothetical protein
MSALTQQALEPIKLQAGIKCPDCGWTSSSVIDSREIPAGVRRRRECDNCATRYSTCEIMRDRFDEVVNGYNRVSGLIASAESIMLEASELRDALLDNPIIEAKKKGVNIRFASCHPDRPYLAKGLCTPCYQKGKREEKKIKLVEVTN